MLELPVPEGCNSPCFSAAARLAEARSFWKCSFILVVSFRSARAASWLPATSASRICCSLTLIIAIARSSLSMSSRNSSFF